jgi:hypothetical protein
MKNISLILLMLAVTPAQAAAKAMSVPDSACAKIEKDGRLIGVGDLCFPNSPDEACASIPAFRVDLAEEGGECFTSWSTPPLYDYCTE